ncbi:MAG: DUF1634 domain-containing protein [Methylocella sp.]
MSERAGNHSGRERAIAGLLWYGTWVASAVIFLGIALNLERIPFLFGLSGSAVIKAGIALFILLPVARVALMLLIFLRERDYAFTTISALVLTIIAAGFLLGL